MTASEQQLKQALQNSPMADAPEVRAAAAASLRVLYAVVLSIQSIEAGILQVAEAGRSSRSSTILSFHVI